MKYTAAVSIVAALAAAAVAYPADEKAAHHTVLVPTHGHFHHSPSIITHQPIHTGFQGHGIHGGHLLVGHRQSEDIKSEVPAETKPEEQRESEMAPAVPEARSYGGYGGAAVLPIAGAYSSGLGGCGISSPQIRGPSVGVFPSSNIGGCAVPLLLSCSPSVSSGHIIKQYGGYSAGYGSAHGAYRETEGNQQTMDKA